MNKHKVPLIRGAETCDIDALNDLCMRSKAFWGYDSTFMEACREELTLRPEDLTRTNVVAAEHEGRIVGVAQIEIEGHDAELMKIFIEPDWIGGGLGRHLFEWAKRTAVQHGALAIYIDSEPNAVQFYERMGARQIGETPSGSIPGRVLPRLIYNLR